MHEFSKKDAAFIERLEKENVDLSKLIKKLNFLIKYCQAAALVMTVFILCIVFVIGEKPKIYHALILLSGFLILLAQYINWKHSLKVIERFKEIKSQRD